MHPNFYSYPAHESFGGKTAIMSRSEGFIALIPEGQDPTEFVQNWIQETKEHRNEQ